MPDADNALSLDSVANEILSMLGDDDDEWSPPKPELADGIGGLIDDIHGKAADAANPDAAAEADSDSPIQPPASWKADAKERFKALPRELQQTIADREREREAHFSKTQQDAVRTRKAVEADRQAVQQERHANLQTMSLMSEAFQTLDPVLAEGAKIDWARLSRENPIAAQAKWTEYQKHLHAANSLLERRAQLMQAEQQAQVQHAHRVLHQHLPEWRDDGQRGNFLNALHHHLHSCGFTPAERNGLVDPRAVMLARDAMLYRQMMAQQAQIAGHRRRGTNGRTLRPQASADHISEKSARAQVLAKRAARTGRLDDQAEAILAALD